MIRTAIVLAACATGCLLKPDKLLGDAGTTDATSDAADPTFVPRLIDLEYFDSTVGTLGMSQLGYSISTSGVHEGDLMLMIANVDNGSNSVFPTDDGFQLIWQRFYAGDQTYVAMYKMATASDVNVTYVHTYGSGHGSGAAVIALLAITGAKVAAPAYSAINGTVAANPVGASSPGITTQAPNSIVIYAAGANWSPSDGDCDFTVPPGFDRLVATGDKGNSMFVWTTELIAWRLQPEQGDSGQIDGDMKDMNGRTGEPWMMAFAIAPN